VAGSLLRILTINIWNNQGPWEKRLQALRAGLADLDPDLIGLQEVLRADDGSFDQLAAIAQELGYEAAFSPVEERTPGVRMGNGVLSRFPIFQVETIRLRQGKTEHQRGAILVRIAGPTGPLYLACTHLDYQFTEGDIRVQQVRQLVDFVRRHSPGGFPPIIVGDFNAEPDSDEIRFLKGLTPLGGESVYFQDAYGLTGTPPGHTWHNKNPFAASCFEPGRRIDYIFVGQPTSPGMGQVLSSQVVLDQPVQGVFPSDHFGVLAEVALEPRSSEPRPPLNVQIPGH